MDTHAGKEDLLQQLSEHNMFMREFPPHARATHLGPEFEWIEGRPLYYYSKERKLLIPAVFIKTSKKDPKLVEIDMLWNGKEIISRRDGGKVDSVSMEYILRRGIDMKGKGNIAIIDNKVIGSFGGFLSTPPEGEDAQKMQRRMNMNEFLMLVKEELSTGKTFPNDIIMIREALGIKSTPLPEPRPATGAQPLASLYRPLPQSQPMGPEVEHIIPPLLLPPPPPTAGAEPRKEEEEEIPEVDGGGLKRLTRKKHKKSKKKLRKSSRRKSNRKKSTRRKSSRRKKSKSKSRRRR